MFRWLAPALAALALLAAGPAVAQGHPSSAEQEFNRLNADRAHQMGMQQYRLRHYDAALRHFEKAVALAPDVDTYRRSLVLTKQRIAIDRANQRRIQNSVNRARKGLAEEQMLDDARQNEGFDDPYGLDAAGKRAGSMGPGSPAAGRATTRERSGDATDGLRLGGDNPLIPPNGGLGDVERELHLGGDSDPAGLPRDLPIAGSGTYDLPVGRLPPEPMLPIPTAGQGASVLPDQDIALPLSGERSMFPFLDPASELPTPGPARPRLDTPEGLP